MVGALCNRAGSAGPDVGFSSPSSNFRIVVGVGRAKKSRR